MTQVELVKWRSIKVSEATLIPVRWQVTLKVAVYFMPLQTISLHPTTKSVADKLQTEIIHS